MAAEAAAAAQARRPKPYVPRALNTGAVTASPRLQAVALMEQVLFFFLFSVTVLCILIIIVIIIIVVVVHILIWSEWCCRNIC